ncbi:MAG: branched-chain amino acid ABC transporter permease [Lachnospiraceae bacterium]|nr:branched-chain amino acid ABC transporter permease [Lachnospiraceae bacterium]
MLKNSFKEKININLLLYLGIIVVSVLILTFLDMNKREYIYAISIIERSLVFAVAALAMNMVTGFTGLFSLGQAGFMALGAYTTAILTIPVELRPNVYYMEGILPALENLSFPIPIAVILGGVVAAFFAFLIGIPILRLKSDYLAIATLGFSEIMRAVIASHMMDKITNGAYGLNNIPEFSSSIECFIYTSICIIAMILIINSSTGRDFKAIREDEIAARSVGINIFKTKELSFVVSSFFTGISGGLLAMYMSSINSSTFQITLTYDVLLIVVLGGIGSITGSIVGAFFVTAGKELLRFFDEPLTVAGVNVPLFKPGFRMVIFSILLMVVVLFFRKGLLGGKELSLNGFKKYSRKKEDKGIQVGGAS